jgi:hypothetical protein
MDLRIVIVLRHLRFFLEPVPSAIVILLRVDSIFQGLLPLLYITDVLIVFALAYLFVRRVIYPQIRYISLASDYFVLLVIAGIAVAGMAGMSKERELTDEQKRSSIKEFNGSIGLPIPSTEVSIRDDDEKELPIKEVGERFGKEELFLTDLVMGAEAFKAGLRLSNLNSRT